MRGGREQEIARITKIRKKMAIVLGSKDQVSSGGRPSILQQVFAFTERDEKRCAGDTGIAPALTPQWRTASVQLVPFNHQCHRGNTERNRETRSAAFFRGPPLRKGEPSRWKNTNHLRS